ncbi:MAG: tRNA pseudouridine(38-40) synthase TruA [Dehalococcoidia bacterium]
MSASRRLALLVEYDGTAFAGSQAQPASRTVQRSLETAIETFTGETQRVRFAGRTDAGVHARGQVVTLDTRAAHSPAQFRRALNHFLPQDVAVRSACEAPSDFEPRRHATSRLYRYVIEDGQPRSPLTRYLAWQRDDSLDASAMAEGASLLPRTRRDWSSFAGRVPEDRSTLRTLLRCDVRRCTPHRLEVWMEADAFLPHQVRRTVGALERVGSGRLTPSAFARLVEAPPASAGPAAPPQGLTLIAVRYPPGLLAWDALDAETVD